MASSTSQSRPELAEETPDPGLLMRQQERLANTPDVVAMFLDVDRRERSLK